MAAVHGPIDLSGKSQATYPIRLGASISKPSDATTRFASIRYNHKPALKQVDDVKASIGSGPAGNELLLEVEGGQYTYRGEYGQDEGTFVLVVKGEGKDREMILERLDGIHAFNLISTPAESDAAKLERLHPHLTEPVGEDDLFGDDDEPDASNPFDYRHFLKAELEKPESVAESSRSNLGTPVVQPAARPPPAARSSKPAAKAKAPVKRKPAAAKANAKRVKAGEEEPTPAKAATSKAKAEAPKIRMDRKASIRKPSIDDSGELILENETPVTDKPPRASGAMAWALNGALSTGPISLASAASSPGLAAEKDDEPEVQEYEFDFGDGSDVEDEQEQSELVLENGDDDGELVLEDDDADVDEHLALPSPAQAHSHRPSVSGVGAPGEDEDDDMEKQLALAMAADDEEEESEEE